MIAARMSGPDAMELDAALEVDPVRRRSRLDEAKDVAGAATATGLRAWVRHLAGLQTIGPTSSWLEGVPPSKIAHFAGEARLTDVSDLRKKCGRTPPPGPHPRSKAVWPSSERWPGGWPRLRPGSYDPV